MNKPNYKEGGNRWTIGPRYRHTTLPTQPRPVLLSKGGAERRRYRRATRGFVLRTSQLRGSGTANCARRCGGTSFPILCIITPRYPFPCPRGSMMLSAAQASIRIHAAKETRKRWKRSEPEELSLFNSRRIRPARRQSVEKKVDVGNKKVFRKGRGKLDRKGTGE